MLGNLSQWIRDRLFQRPGTDTKEAKKLVAELERHADELTVSASELQEELQKVKTTAEEKGTDPLAELVRSMQRGRKKMELGRQ